MDYKVEGRLLVVPIVGFGFFKGNFSKSKSNPIRASFPKYDGALSRAYKYGIPS